MVLILLYSFLANTYNKSLYFCPTTFLSQNSFQNQVKLITHTLFANIGGFSADFTLQASFVSNIVYIQSSSQWFIYFFACSWLVNNLADTTYCYLSI